MNMCHKLLAIVAFTLPALSFGQTETSAVKAYSTHVFESYQESLDRAVLMKAALENFTQNPSVLTMEVAKSAWIYARESYGQTEVFRFYNGPIDRDGGPEGQLNAWPLDENYIDYVVGAPNSGIINDTKNYPAITKELLISLNELDGEKNISTGFHAIEFLLWGQDLFADGSGKRSFEDYLTSSNSNATRRAKYLHIVTDLLIEDLQGLVKSWQSGRSDNFRLGFEAQDNKKSLKNILTGLIYMAGDELSGERMYVAYDTMGQEDEHSCFSDMTHMDIQWNYWGVENVLSATGILELPSVKGTTQAQAVKARMIETRALLASIPVPFDQAILSTEGREIILASVISLETLAVELVEVSKLLGATVEF